MKWLVATLPFLVPLLAILYLRWSDRRAARRERERFERMRQGRVARERAAEECWRATRRPPS